MEKGIAAEAVNAFCWSTRIILFCGFVVFFDNAAMFFCFPAIIDAYKQYISGILFQRLHMGRSCRRCCNRRNAW